MAESMMRSGANISRRLTPHLETQLTPWLFVAPSLLVVLAVTIFPTLYSLYLSFFQWEPTIPDKPYIGLGNYVELFRTGRFLSAFGVTALITLVGVALEMGIGFWFADFVMADRRGHRLVVALMLLPVMVMPVVVGYTWRLLWDAAYGPINQVLGWILMRPIEYTWLGQTSTALLAIIVTEVWQWTPFMFLIFYAGMASLDGEVYEASEIDGANAWQQFWQLTVPLMLPIVIVAVLIRAVDCIKMFDVIYTLTGGAPGTSTETVSYYIYQVGYQFFRLGYGSAASIVLLIVLSVLLTFLLRALRSRMS
ncbi:MAG: sugar ABC transporter permease [Caldilineaceae bacterium]|nr:sugar ABC transporter permease [Caldilineaceae bacterium]